MALEGKQDLRVLRPVEVTAAIRPFKPEQAKSIYNRTPSIDNQDITKSEPDEQSNLYAKGLAPHYAGLCIIALESLIVVGFIFHQYNRK